MKKMLLLLVALIVFYFSNTPNLRVINPNTWLNEPKYEENVKDLTFLLNIDSSFYEQYSDEKNMDFFLHKLGHIIFYSILTILLYINIGNLRFKSLITWLLITIYAIIDEIHQFFVIGRSGRIIDVVLDSSTSIIILIFIFIFNLIKRNNQIKK